MEVSGGLGEEGDVSRLGLSVFSFVHMYVLCLARSIYIGVE